MQLSLVIPIYNEAASILETGAALRSTLTYLRSMYAVEVIVVDDNSHDNSTVLLQATLAGLPDIHYIRHEQNQGVGATLRTGIGHAQGDIIITTDFDGSYPLNAIPQLVGRMIVDQADVVIASPYHPNGSRWRSRGNHVVIDGFISLLYRLFVNRHIHSWTSLLCAYQGYVLDRLAFTSDRPIATTELLVNAVRTGYSVSEVPINLSSRRAGRSRIHALRLLFTHLEHLYSGFTPHTRRLLTTLKRSPKGTNQSVLKEN